ncbi:hydroxyacid dehydrogenase [Lacibacterium aquatile]|uniref:Hydroxyacid dehydrogenase n=1 Tax=Lacibacterium aquatile TaxID=1168082 RepID=A0ABW5DP16_9PROT
MPDIVISEFMDEAAVADLKRDFDTHYDPNLVDHPAELRAAIANARALIVRNRTQVRGELLASGGKLKAVGRLGVGLDNIDMEACAAREIAVFPASGANDVSVAEYVMAGALMLLRGAYFSSPETRSGGWPRGKLMGREVFERTIGLIGFGGIARAVAKRARAFDMRIVAYDPFIPSIAPIWAEHGVEPLAFDDLIAQSDVVSLHVPLTDKTKYLLDDKALAATKPGAIVINASRGGVVDEAALVRALASGRLGGAMLDVFEREPLGAENVFPDLPNLILTPHIAGVTEESNVRVSSVTAQNIRRALS